MAARKAAAVKEPTLDEELSAEERREGDVEVDLSEPETPEEDELEHSEPAQPGQTRKEKKQQRGTLRDEAERARQEAESERQARIDAERRAAAAEGYAAGMRQARGGVEEDPIDAEIGKIVDEEESLLAAYRAREKTLTEEQALDFRKKARALQGRRTALETQKALRQNAPSREQAAAAENARAIQARYPDLVADPKAFQWAYHRASQLIAEGHPPGWDTSDLAANEARARFFPGARKPDESLSRKLQGAPAGARGNAPAATMTLSKHDVAMANEKFAHLKSEPERLKAYAKFIREARSKQKA